MRVGFASDNGTAVNECLLSDTTWWIYEIDSTAELVDKRTCLCSGSCREFCPVLTRNLKDCDLLFVENINSEYYAQLAASGIQLLESPLKIKELIPRLIRCISQGTSISYFKRVFQLSSLG